MRIEAQAFALRKQLREGDVNWESSLSKRIAQSRID
ncbi:protein of unknown function [Agrobacterium pusense]|uniref:Uncharacterized protein n=1 Tax=Agrobacterium pusense TaxID=648995 RepID=U4Q6Y9_9HYPH|nr:protein of unknown function [Agrobacterium pusense]